MCVFNYNATLRTVNGLVIDDGFVLYVCCRRFELCAAVGVCDDGELAGSGGRDGGRGFPFDRVDAGEGSLADGGSGIVLALGLHCNFLRWALSSGLGVVEVCPMMLKLAESLEGVNEEAKVNIQVINGSKKLHIRCV